MSEQVSAATEGRHGRDTPAGAPADGTVRGSGAGFDVVRSLLGLQDGGDFVVAPRRSDPRFIIPVASRSAARSACWSYHRLRGRRAALGRLGAGLVLSSPFDRRVFPDRLGAPVPGGLVDAIAGLVGEPVLPAVGFGAVDEWWTPTLHLFARDGRVLGFAKLGWTTLTRRQVANEGDALADLARSPIPGINTPHVLGRFTHPSGPAGPVEVVVTAPLPADVRSLEGIDRPPLGPLLSLAEHRPGPTGPLVGSGFWSRLLADLAPITGHPEVDPDGVVEQAVSAVSDRFGEVVLRTCRFHGDYAGWNLGVDGRGDLSVFDWEHSDAAAPVGLDLAHGVHQNELRRRLADGGTDFESMTASAMAEVCGAASRERLGGLGLVGTEADAVTALESLFVMSLIGRAVGAGVVPTPTRRDVVRGAFQSPALGA